jgi:hypothetical protein
VLVVAGVHAQPAEGLAAGEVGLGTPLQLVATTTARGWSSPWLVCTLRRVTRSTSTPKCGVTWNSRAEASR